MMEDQNKIEKRGFAYQCVKCGEYTGEKRYVEAHVFKQHLALDQVPFYCSLCQYMSRTEKDLTKHLKGYRPHHAALLALAQVGKEAEAPESYLKKNAHPVSLDESFVKRLSLQESRAIWIQRAKQTPSATKTKTDERIIQVRQKEEKEPAEQKVEPERVPMPEALKTKEPVVQMPVLPDIDLPPLTEDQEFDLLEEILGDENNRAAEEFPMEVEADTKREESNEATSVLKEIKEILIQHTQLLTTLNTGVRKNTMAIDELAASIRAMERRERNTRLWSSPYNTFNRRTSTQERPRTSGANPRVRSAVSVVRRSRR